jgi:MscS family membrane protein
VLRHPAASVLPILGLILALARPAAAEEPTVGAVSPRALVEAFLVRTDAQDWAGAARLLEFSPRSAAEGERLVRRLRVVLDQYGAPDLEALSPAPEGELEDGLAADRERIPGGGRDREGAGALTLVRVETSEGPRWVISRATLGRVDGWYRALPTRWLVERLPPAFARPGPLGLQPWQWLAAGAALLLSLPVALLLEGLTSALVRLIGRRRKRGWDQLAVSRLRGPLIVCWYVALLRALLPLAAFPEKSFLVVKHIMRAGFAAALFWAAIGAVEAVQIALAHDSTNRPGRRALLGLGGRMLKMVLALMAVVVVMASLGFSVTSLVAGIGVGGLGLALAAQKTVENVFGAFSLGVDQPFREGDAIQVDGVVGTVESIGLRSTRIRTLDRTIVAIPNGKLAEMKTESLTARDRFRLYAKLGLHHSASPVAVARILSQIEALLRAHEKAGIDAQARLTGLTAAGVELEVSCSFLTTNFDEFGQIRQQMLLSIMGIVEEAEARWSAPGVLPAPPK